MRHDLIAALIAILVAAVLLAAVTLAVSIMSIRITEAVLAIYALLTLTP